MNRRLFLRTIAAGLGAALVDPERLLWSPGKKLISIARPRGPYTVSDLIAEANRGLAKTTGGLFNPHDNVAKQYDAAMSRFALDEVNAILDRWNDKALILFPSRRCYP